MVELNTCGYGARDMATMRDVAKAAGVSIATVSSALSGAAYVSPELKAKVQAAVEALGYERNSMASGLKRGRSSLIGLIVSDVTNPFFTELVDRVETEARAAGYTVLLGISNHDPGRERDLVRLMRSHQAAGTIVTPAGGPDDVAPDLFAGRMPLVAVDNAWAGLPCDTVALDHRRAAALAVEHILRLGHRRVATITGPERQFVSRERLAGFRDTLAAAGIAVDDRLVRQGEFRIDEAYAACRELASGPDRPTAVFVANNLMLIGAMRALADAGLKVPDDVSVAGIDDFPWAPAFQPALTVVRQPIAAMASAALDRLVHRMNGGDGPPAHIVLPADLVVRRSCAAPRAD